MMEFSTLWLMFILGLRHGLDADHVAVIDNIVFRASERRARFAPWAGSFFALGHSLSVAAVAIGVSLIAGSFAMPDWMAHVIDGAVIALLLLVGSLNLAALLRAESYTPVGWRTGLIPRPLRASTHPVAVIAIGAIFGLVFDTATQAAAWGAAATAKGGTLAALVIVSTFALGMILADTCDSQIVARLLGSAGKSPALVRRYRRGVGWLVVVLSYGMATYALADALDWNIGLGDGALGALGIGSVLLMIALIASQHWLARRSRV